MNADISQEEITPLLSTWNLLTGETGYWHTLGQEDKWHG